MKVSKIEEQSCGMAYNLNEDQEFDNMDFHNLDSSNLEKESLDSDGNDGLAMDEATSKSSVNFGCSNLQEHDFDGNGNQVLVSKLNSFQIFGEDVDSSIQYFFALHFAEMLENEHGELFDKFDSNPRKLTSKSFLVAGAVLDMEKNETREGRHCESWYQSRGICDLKVQLDNLVILKEERFEKSDLILNRGCIVLCMMFRRKQNTKRERIKSNWDCLDAFFCSCSVRWMISSIPHLFLSGTGLMRLSIQHSEE